MNVYSIRDRFLDYYMTPFMGDNDRAVIAALAEIINGGTPHVISQTPQHFEIWRLAEISDKTGDVNQVREYLADCASLVRGGVRKTSQPDGSQGNSQAGNPAAARQGEPGLSGTGRSPAQRAVEAAMEPEDRTPPNACEED